MLMQQSGPDAAALRELRRQVLARRRPGRGGGGASAWSMTAPLSGAVIAPAQLKVELNRKTVQHQEGGIVRQVLVRDGQKVRAGELIVVGDVRSDSTLKLLQDQLAAEKIREARGRRSRPRAAFLRASPIARARALRHAPAHPRRADCFAQTQIREAEAQASALQAQIEATETSARLSAEELEMNDRLARQGFVNRTRLLALQRTEADYRARVGEYRSELAAARQRIADMRASRRRATSIRARPPTSCATRPPRCATWKSACARRKTRSSARSCARRSTAK